MKFTQRLSLRVRLTLIFLIPYLLPVNRVVTRSVQH